MRSVLTLLTIALALPAAAAAQPAEPRSDLSGYTRFLVYPHLQKGWESMQRGEKERALAEFERARTLAPDDSGVALALASAYRTFGEEARAGLVLRDQLTRTPADPRVRNALADVERTVSPAAPAAVDALQCTASGSPRCPAASPAGGRRSGKPVRAARGGPEAGRGVQAALTARRRERATRVSDGGTTEVASADRSTDARAAFEHALQSGRFDDALRHADGLLASDGGSAAILDEVTYKLAAAGGTPQASRALLRAYPFASASPPERDTLLQRLISLLQQQRIEPGDPRLTPLRAPLDTPALRSRQAVLWAGLADCDAVRLTLGDMSADYRHDDWMRLGDCSGQEAPQVATRAYSEAHTLRRGGPASRALAYRAYAERDFATALDAWRSVEVERLSGDELFAAVTTALAAGDDAQAVAWLTGYRNRGAALDHHFWYLLAQGYRSTDSAGSADALRRAVELHPSVDGLVRLAQLESETARQVRWLESAVELDRNNPDTQAALAYAYVRDGRPASALRAFERAAVLDPANMQMQLELGYAYWRAGRVLDAQGSLERAWQADPGNTAIAQQLVYVHQRLSQNHEARRYAETVLDALPPPADTAGAEAAALADRRFGLQRLHEDLGRRVTLAADGWTGTGVGTGTGAAQAGSRYRSYSQLEGDLRLGSPPVRDGATLSAYARLISDGGELPGILPTQNATLGLGLRWKPWRNRVVYLAAENQTGLDGRSRRDVLLRASASFLNGGRYGDDWHASPSGWFSRNLYLDAAQYLESRQAAFTADYRAGYHRKVAAAQTVEPYAHLQVNGVRTHGSFEPEIRSGAGVRWNLWYGATTYDAVPHKVSVGIEFQQAIRRMAGSDRNGLFLALGTRW